MASDNPNYMFKQLQNLEELGLINIQRFRPRGASLELDVFLNGLDQHSNSG
jgi:hypothetical protein